MSIEDKEAEIIQKEAKKDDASELGLSDDVYTNERNVNPFDNDEVQGMLAEKDYKISELDDRLTELAGYINTGQVEKHPEYLRLKAQNDHLILENAELTEALRKLTKQSLGSSFKPAAEIQGSLGQ